LNIEIWGEFENGIWVMLGYLRKHLKKGVRSFVLSTHIFKSSGNQLKGGTLGWGGGVFVGMSSKSFEITYLFSNEFLNDRTCVSKLAPNHLFETNIIHDFLGDANS
jgi:hypothetical protein